MALLHSFTFLSPLPSSSSSLPVPTTLSLRLQCKSIPRVKALNRVKVFMPRDLEGRRFTVVVHASSEVDGAEGNEPEAAPSNGSEEVVPVENLPLESKLQEKLAQKLKMKLAKKIRLRRKRLLRKRKLRKKGSWPPSKMRKLKNV